MADMKSVLEKGLKHMQISRLADEKIEAPENDVEYPYGLKLSLCKKELELLGLDVEKINVGKDVEFNCRAFVTSVSKDPSGYSESKRVELQITHLGMEDD